MIRYPGFILKLRRFYSRFSHPNEEFMSKTEIIFFFFGVREVLKTSSSGISIRFPASAFGVFYN